MNYYEVIMHSLLRGGWIDVYKNHEEIISIDFGNLKQGHALAKKLATEYGLKTYTHERTYCV